MEIKKKLYEGLSEKFKDINSNKFESQIKPDIMYFYSEPLVSQITSGIHEGEYISQN